MDHLLTNGARLGEWLAALGGTAEAERLTLVDGWLDGLARPAPDGIAGVHLRAGRERRGGAVIVIGGLARAVPIGLAAAVEVMMTLADAGIETDHPLMLVTAPTAPLPAPSSDPAAFVGLAFDPEAGDGSDHVAAVIEAGRPDTLTHAGGRHRGDSLTDVLGSAARGIGQPLTPTGSPAVLGRLAALTPIRPAALLLAPGPVDLTDWDDADHRSERVLEAADILLQTVIALDRWPY